MSTSILDNGGACLVVSQFTLAANVRKGNRPSFQQAAAPDLALRLYERFVASLVSLGFPSQRAALRPTCRLSSSTTVP